MQPLQPSNKCWQTIDRFPNYCLGARRGKDLVAKGCYGPWRVWPWYTFERESSEVSCLLFGLEVAASIFF